MKVVKAIVLASTLLVVGGVGAWAQSGSAQRPAGTPAPAGGGISAATHCLDSAGVAARPRPVAPQARLARPLRAPPRAPRRAAMRSAAYRSADAM
jgi:hypothetical protein